MPTINFTPPLLNSANPWCTDYSQLKELYECPHTGAVTTRTCTLTGFEHDDAIHQVGFFSSSDYSVTRDTLGAASLNTLGYSPISLRETLVTIKQIVSETTAAKKPVIISVTGSSSEVLEAIKLVSQFQLHLPIQLLVEINLSCPNITGKPPPAFSLEGLKKYLITVHMACIETEQSLTYKASSTAHRQGTAFLPVPIGIKTPPYSNPDDFKTLRWALLGTMYPFPIRDHPNGASTRTQSLSFITACNTLGCSLILDPKASSTAALSSADASGIGGLAGAPLHPLALGNVRMLRSMLDAEVDLKHITIIGIGGVSDSAGFYRMKSVGAAAVGVGTALGLEGVRVFAKILGN
jgi:dihydroorotate dehydrogenase (fumarate)